MTYDRCGKDCGERGDNEIILCGDCIKELHDAFVKWMNITAPFLKKVKKMNRKTKKLMERLEQIN